MLLEFKLPQVGENIEKATVIRVLVAEGERVEEEQSVIEIETDKATIEVPSTFNGTVLKLNVKEGDEIDVGGLIMTVDDGSGPAQPAGDQTSGAKTGPAQRAATVVSIPSSASAGLRPSSAEAISATPASPSARRLAREIGVEISEVTGTGPGGRVTHADIKAYARDRATPRTAPPAAPVEKVTPNSAVSPPRATPSPGLPDFSVWGETESVPLSRIRQIIAQRMSHAWATVPHVHQFGEADITLWEQMRRRYNASVEDPAKKLTITVVLIKALARLLRDHPKFNASLDQANNTIIYKRYINIGVAAATERGLLVPVVHDADGKALAQVGAELGELARKARDGKLAPDEMSGGTFTITNLGGIGGTIFNPIINHPEVAILAVGRASRWTVVGEDGRSATPLLLPLCLGYDHRVIDGAEGASFLRDLCQLLTNPLDTLLEA